MNFAQDERLVISKFFKFKIDFNCVRKMTVMLFKYFATSLIKQKSGNVG